MSDFDAYHKWLGIPAAEQPPNHYRLLGVSLFEKDKDVLIAALDQRQRFLMQKAVGPRGELVGPMMEQLQHARLCLLNRLTKAQYDSMLRQQGVGAPAAVLPSQPIGQIVEVQSAPKKEKFEFPTEADLGSRTERDIPSERQVRRVARIMNLLVLCGFGIGIWWMWEIGRAHV